MLCGFRELISLHRRKDRPNPPALRIIPTSPEISTRIGPRARHTNHHRFAAMGAGGGFGCFGRRGRRFGLPGFGLLASRRELRRLSGLLGLRRGNRFACSGLNLLQRFVSVEVCGNPSATGNRGQRVGEQRRKPADEPCDLPQHSVVPEHVISLIEEVLAPRGQGICQHSCLAAIIRPLCIGHQKTVITLSDVSSSILRTGRHSQVKKRCSGLMMSW